MATSTPLSRLRRASRLCTYGAGIIGVMGLILAILYTFVQWSTFAQIQQQGLSFAFSIATGIFLIVSLTLFFALTLYALGTLLHYLSRGEKTQKEDSERMEIIAIPALQEEL